MDSLLFLDLFQDVVLYEKLLDDVRLYNSEGWVGKYKWDIFTRYYKGYQIKKDEMRGTFSMHGRGEKCI
jgi:hypothetical protein